MATQVAWEEHKDKHFSPGCTTPTGLQEFPTDDPEHCADACLEHVSCTGFMVRNNTEAAGGNATCIQLPQPKPC